MHVADGVSARMWLRGVDQMGALVESCSVTEKALTLTRTHALTLTFTLTALHRHS